MSKLIFGTSGWYYKDWIGPVYDSDKRRFSFYTKFFGTSEINSTFYRYPSKSMMFGLFRSSPKDFVFSAKLPKLITHQKRMDLDLKVENDLLRFLELLNPLKASGKLGAILIQLPPSFTFNEGHSKLKEFFAVLPESYEFAVEFRNLSWMQDETWKLLENNNVAYTIVDEPLLLPETHVTADFAYMRWHGRGRKLWYKYRYKEEELNPWVSKVEKVADETKKVYGYFNNHYYGYAIENCVQLLEKMGEAKEEQVQIKDKIIQHNLKERPEYYK